MAIIEFPPLSQADESGLLAIGGDLEIESLVLAYSEGIFPWPIKEEFPLTWFSPDPRGVIPLDNLHIPRSLKKFMSKCPYEIRYNTRFEEVINECSKVPRKNQESTWITSELKQAYINLFHHKLAYSVEAYSNNKLVGGVYGVCIGEIFSGESMFHKETNASKVCLLNLIEKIKPKGIKLLDTQMVTPVIQSLGGVEIPRNVFVKEIKKAHLNKSRHYYFSESNGQ